MDFLSRTGRAIKFIVPDGNCFFRAVSFHIFGDESNHLSVRAKVLKFEQINEYIFAKFLMPPVNKPSFQEHIEFLQRPGSWATQVEVLTVATMFQVPVYYCKSSQDDVSYWEVTNPLKCKSPANEESLDDVFYMAKIPHHFELVYWDRSHYDCVVVQTTGVCSSSAPLLTGTKSYIDITNN